MTSLRHPLEESLAVSLRHLLVWAIPLSGLMLVVRSPLDADGLFLYNVGHLLILQIAAYALVRTLAPLTDRPWFEVNRRPWLASSASVIALVTGVAALLTLATSAAARYDPSLQFLQLLSSLDIAWATAALFLGARRLWGTRVADWAAIALIIICVGSIALYLDVVGFDQTGGWLVDAGNMMRIVLPADMVAATAALIVLLTASKRGPVSLLDQDS